MRLKFGGLGATRPIILVVDGHSIHKSGEVKAFVVSTEDMLELCYLPPYSPQLNPDEQVWTHIKGRVAKQKPTDQYSLRILLQEALERLQGLPEIVVEKCLTTKALAQLGEAGGKQAKGLKVKVRLVRVVLPSGRIEVLATSLLDSAAHPSESFAALYKSRWKIEEAFKTLKHRLHLEGFTGELPHVIEQLQASALEVACADARLKVAHDVTMVCGYGVDCASI